MITVAEKDALLQYLEFLLVKELLEPVVAKHVHDPDIVGHCYDQTYAIINELEQEIENYRIDNSVDCSKHSR